MNQDGGRRERDERLRDNGDRDRDERLRDGDRDDDDHRRDFDRDQEEPDFWEGDFDPAGREFDIVTGKPDESIMLFRMESLVPTVTMPKVPHRLINEEGVALIREWILAMDEVELESQQIARN